MDAQAIIWTEGKTDCRLLPVSIRSRFGRGVVAANVSRTFWFEPKALQGITIQPNTASGRCKRI
jgi:hypothetical protein